ncbi:MAG: hypothetical protein HKN81_08155 [Gammaproteobacteria bacterium]|nr:hypothetical protein [Gammaproteobacteria bacterium]
MPNVIDESRINWLARTGLQAAPVTAEQLRAARAMLNLSQAAFAGRLGISLDDLRSLESQSGPLHGDPAELRDVSAALHRLGVELVPAGVYVGAGGPGVRLKRRAKRAQSHRMPAEDRGAAKQVETDRVLNRQIA